MKKRNFFAVCLILFAVSAKLFAQGDAFSSRKDTLSLSLDEVVITATHAETHRNNVPMTLSVVSREEIEESSESALLPVLSEQVPGMFVTEKGITGFGVGSSGAGGIFLRGVGGGNQLLILIDGHPQYMGVMGHHLPDAYVASDVEKVEVIRGPASILYGSNAMGGVINIITRKQKEEGWSANGRVMYGSYNTQKYMANGGLRKGKWDGFVSINHDRTDGHRDNSKFNITNGYARAGYNISNHFNLWGDISIASYETQNPGAVASPMTDNIADILRGVASATLENQYEKTNGTFKLFYNFGDHKINDGYASGSNPKDYYFRAQDYNYGINWYQIFQPFRGNTLTAGIDFKNFGGHAWDELNDKSAPNREWTDTTLYEVAGYLIAQQNLFEKLTLNAGLRLENNEAFGNEWVPQVGLAYRPFRSSVLKASISKGFRSPNIQNLYYRAAWAGHNPDLKPEEMINYEVSIGQVFLEGRLSAELTGFIADGKNLIVTEGAYPNFKNENSGEFKNTGLELSVKWELMKNLRIHGNYSCLQMNHPILYSPEQQIYLSANYRWNKWIFNAGYQSVTGLYSVLASTDREGNPTPPKKENYGLLNAKVSYQPLKCLTVFAKGENLTDTKYQILNDYPMPGITIFGGIHVSLK
jgi:iron complex outermembrane receptor protein